MKRMFSGLQRRVTSPLQTQDSSSPSPDGLDTPKAIVVREIKAFCGHAGGPNDTANEYVHLPAIVEAAESSAGAAKEAAAQIRKNLSSPSSTAATVQYNSIMLIRILSENPGHSFTRNIDAKFVSTIKNILRDGRHIAAQQMLRETLDLFESQKSWDEDLAALLAMWKKEKERGAKYSRSSPAPSQANPQFQQPYFARPVPAHGQLPPPDELASRVSEAKTSANLLIQLAQSTPAAEVQSHELMREFSQRCQAASRSIQSYMAVENPPPDENTMLTLIETNEQLSVALSKYQRAILNARKALGAATPAASNSDGNSPVNGTSNGEAATTMTTSRSDSASPADSGSAAVSSPFPSLMHATVNEPFSVSTLPAELQASTTKATTATPNATSPPPPTSTQQPTSRRYEYNADEFNVENPFADNAAEDSFQSEDHPRLHSREV